MNDVGAEKCLSTSEGGFISQKLEENLLMRIFQEGKGGSVLLHFVREIVIGM
jgi:hypothetical protein